MSERTRWIQFTLPWLRRLPADLVATVGFTVLTVGVVFLPIVRDTPLRTVVGLLFVLFVPGYALVAVLFPAGSVERTGIDDVVTGRTRITATERAALSFGISVAIVPLVSVVLNFTPWGIRLVPIVVSLAVVVFGLTAAAGRRRKNLPAEDRFAVPWRSWARRTRTGLVNPESRTDAVLNVMLAVSIVFATATVGYAVAAPQRGETFTEFYLVSETEDGELVAKGYPSEFVAGESKSLVIGVENQELQTVDYTVLVEIHRMRMGDNTTTVLQAKRLQTFEFRLEQNETWRRSHAVAPEMLGEQLRLTYMLYRGDPPLSPTRKNAYRELHLWINVTSTR